VKRKKTVSLDKWRNRRGKFSGWLAGGGVHAAGLEGFLSRHRMRCDNQTKEHRTKEICYLDDKKKEEKKQVANVHAHINHIRFLYIRLFIFLSRCFGSIWRTGEGILREARKKQRM